MSDLEKNQILAEWLRWQLRQTEIRIRELNTQEEQERHRRERARAERSWKIQPPRAGRPAMLHRGGCTLSAGEHGLIDREEALIAMTEPDIEACNVCRPETGLT
ncbi:DUF6233 domain-containing protein [Streptomyces sp. NPDC057682]|uniref:DUF6233 domain-containing protein n=1 Tax=Streptomyces sp. NPDC057682 TaxID=3346210 RepID=UPI00369D2DCB